MGRAEVLEKVSKAVLPVLEHLGYDLVEVAVVVSHGRRILQVFIDCQGHRQGVTVEDCARASKALSECLDQQDVFPGRYFLEVSSPGAERRLKRPEDFARFAGRKARLRFRGADGRVLEATGALGECEGDVVVLKPEGAPEIRVRLEDVVGANLAL